MVELIWRIGVHLGGHAHLSEAQARESQQRIVSRHALLEQGVNPPGPWLGRGPPGAATAAISSGTIHAITPRRLLSCGSGP
jgi:hypothetical protein